MTKLNAALGLTFSLVVLGGSFAEADVCFQDISSYNAVKAQLPPVLQSYPLYATHESFELTGAFQIQANGNNVEIDAHVKPIIGSPLNEVATITNACLSGDQLQVTLSNNITETITVNNSSVTIEGFEFDVTDLATYQKIAAKIPAK